MNKETSLNKRGSILERAAEVFDFQREFQMPPIPPAAPEIPEAPAEQSRKMDDTVILPVSEPGPAAKPAEPTPQAVLRRESAPVRGRSIGRRVNVDRALLASRGFIEPEGPITGLAEEFRIIKRRLLLGASERGGIDEAKRRTILVCSAQPDEGKTFCAVNLALSMAVEQDLEVLLIDADTANSEIPSLLGIEADSGLSDAIADPSCDVNSLVIQTDIGGLSILPSGRFANNITELLSSARSSEVLRALTVDHPNRLVIFDSPPALVASPAGVLASHAGQIMLVVCADQTTESDLRETVSLLSACEHISLVLNRASPAVSGRRFGSYYGQEQ
jgi:protein-tyrosine kinase